VSKSVEELTEEARRSVAAARRAAGEPWQDDSDKDIFWLAAEAEAICEAADLDVTRLRSDLAAARGARRARQSPGTGRACAPRTR